MNVTRRGFLKLSGLSIAALATGLGFDLSAAEAQGYALKLEGCKKYPVSVTFVQVDVVYSCMLREEN
jgi:anaerobic selenocysteine-containing dehydrogenase